MNHYTELLYYIKGLAESDTTVNTVTQGDFTSLDLEKKNLYKLVHVQINSANFSNGQTVGFSVQVGCFDIRDTNKEVITDKFWKQDNEVDNMNETLAVLNRMWTKMYTDFDEQNITANADPTLEPMFLGKKNLIDGWIMTFDVEMPNTTLNLCQ